MRDDRPSGRKPGSNDQPRPRTPGADPRVETLRALAGQGRLAKAATTAAGDRAALTGAVYTLAWPIVFAQLTRRVELRRGHVGCAQAVYKLAPECLDRFQDDVEAVVEDTLRHADKPINNLEAWIASRLTAATVDAHRRLRGSRGALQRPRAPKWLSALLGDDPWLVDLAVQILVWSGVPMTAGAELWPLDAWSERRAAITGDRAGSTPAVVRREVGAVLAAMRQRTAWYADYVERPLGRKQAPAAAEPQVGTEGAEGPKPLALAGPDEADEALLGALAEDALQAIRRLLERGEDARAAVTAVIGTLFGADDVVREIDRPPHCAPGPGERVASLLRDPAEAERIVAAVLGLLGDEAREL